MKIMKYVMGFVFLALAFSVRAEVAVDFLATGADPASTVVEWNNLGAVVAVTADATLAPRIIGDNNTFTSPNATGNIKMTVSALGDDVTAFNPTNWTGGTAAQIATQGTGWGIGDSSGNNNIQPGEAFILTFNLSELVLAEGDSIILKSMNLVQESADVWEKTGDDSGTHLSTGAIWAPNISIEDGKTYALVNTGTTAMRLFDMTIDIAPAAEIPTTLTVPSELSMSLAAPSGSTNESFNVQFAYGAASNNVEISSVVVSNQTHPGSFSCLNTNFPVIMTNPGPSNETFTIGFENSVAGLVNDGETASGTVAITWNEVGNLTSYVEEMPVSLLYIAPATDLLLSPASSLALTILAPATTASKTLEVSYIADAWAPTNVVISGIEFTNTTHAAFSCTNTFPITLTDPTPSNEVLGIVFDAAAAGLANGESATGNVVLVWNEVGSTNVHQTVLPVSGVYHVLEPSTGTIVEWGNTMPTNNIVVKSEPVVVQSPDISRRGELDGGYSKVGQTIHAEALDGDETAVDSLLLKTDHDFDFTQSSGANQLQIWFGKFDTETGGITADLGTELFDCAGRFFPDETFLQFNFSAPINFDPANLGVDEAYAFQLWWTTEDPDNYMDFQRGLADTFPGGIQILIDPAAADTTFPVTLDDVNENREHLFAFASGLNSVTEIADVQIGSAGGNAVLNWQGVLGASYAVQRKTDLVYGTWSNVVEGLTGTGIISVTNDTTEPRAFYRTILE